ncbi:hypothetical protein [Motiliproteus sp. MSK22-1]|uniref:hypothetical protein n=1 Tax=Motiliproteus sp. MSK22-1 TaxID=1897630 RepID=UPI0009760092|nr:hypothetical protein [Motiliproteus sp. MSK22-1]OMH30282.1 hypothetical protein BGP75_17980 [Motiliproteus sp. MSK22-1]
MKRSILLILTISQTFFFNQASADQNGQVPANNVIVYSHNTATDTYIDTLGEFRGKHHGGRGAFLTELVRELMISVNQQPLIEKHSVEQAIESLEDQQLIAVIDINRTTIKPLNTNGSAPC